MESLRVFIQADVSVENNRQIVRGAADFGHALNPPWKIDWGTRFPSSSAIKRAGYNGAIRLTDDRPRDDLRMPTVRVSSARLLAGCIQVMPDNFAIGRLAAAHFLERIYRNFAFVGPNGLLFASERYEAFAQSIGGPVRWIATDPANPSDPREDRRLAESLSGLPEHCALFAATDSLARHVILLCEKIQRHVPGEIAVLGVDNDLLLTLSSPVDFSSIDPAALEMGRRAASLLDALMAGQKPSPPLHRVPPAGVVPRHSTDRLASADDRLNEAVRILRRHACEGLGVPDLCRRTGMSRRVLEERFKTQLHSSPQAEIRRIRLAAAADLLATTLLPVDEIAARCGFADPFYFSTAFRKSTGLSPRAWRALPSDQRPALSG